MFLVIAALQPHAFSTSSVTGYEPTAVKVCVGDNTVLVMPSYVHSHIDTGDQYEDEESIKVNSILIHTGLGSVLNLGVI